MMTQVKITYVWHDCFLVETPEAALVFDFWTDPLASPYAMPQALAALRRDLPLYVFVSHGHKDHYNPAVFAWASEFADVRYIVSRDVEKRTRHITGSGAAYSGPRIAPEAMIPLRPGQSWRDARIEVRACGSTDIGNSYLVTLGAHTFFHAGDLNAWVWKDESTDQEIRKAMGDYRAALRDIPHVPIDYCFFPVDSRIGRDYWEGASIFVREFEVGCFFPMHFSLGDDEERRIRLRDALRFDLYANPARGLYVPLAIPGSSFLDNGPAASNTSTR